MKDYLKTLKQEKSNRFFICRHLLQKMEGQDQSDSCEFCSA